ncbi:MAG: T9SS type A sorting domain-containing protein, partial [Bacteroidota bacterium]|nr:T9SS type A sorting domain-containing protein [Bacteroidota bacterium]
IMAGTASGTISVIAGSSCGTSAPTTLGVNINARPVVGATAAAGTICDGATDQLTANGATSYAWSSGGTTAVEMVTPAATTTYSVVGTDGNGCSDTAMVTVIVNPLPVVAIVPNTSTICEGTNDTLTANGAMNYAWSTGGSSPIEIVSPATTTTYTVVGTDANGCTNSATATVNVNAAPVITITGAGSICGGGSDTLTGNGAVSYSWSSGGTTATEIVMPSASATYTLTGTDINGCTNTATATVIVNPTPVVDLGADTSVCGQLMLDAMNAGAMYLWNNNSTAQTLNATSSGTYYVTVTNVSGCTGSDTIALIVNAIPMLTLTSSDSSLCLTDANAMLSGTPAGGTWSGPGVTGSSFNASSAGVGAQNVFYTFTSVDGCEAVSSLTINVNACVGIATQTEAAAIAVFPNPNAGQFTFVAPANGTVVIFNNLGQVVFSSKVMTGNNPLAIGTADSGIYFIRFTDEQNNVHQSKMTIQQ